MKRRHGLRVGLWNVTIWDRAANRIVHHEQHRGTIADAAEHLWAAWPADATPGSHRGWVKEPLACGYTAFEQINTEAGLTFIRA